MLFRCYDNTWIERIKKYIGDRLIEEPYVYINLSRYGCLNPSVQVWVDIEDETISAVVLCYYDSLHVFTKDNQYNYAGLVTLIEKIKPRVIMSQENIGEAIMKQAADLYCVERCHILEIHRPKSTCGSANVYIADRTELGEIAQLMMLDHDFSAVYSLSSLLAQLQSRYDDGFGRFYVIRSLDGVIAATYGTYAEFDGIAILSGLMTRGEYRKRGYATKIMQYAWENLICEGFRCLTFVLYGNEPSLNLHAKVGATRVSTIYKFIRR